MGKGCMPGPEALYGQLCCLSCERFLPLLIGFVFGSCFRMLAVILVSDYFLLDLKNKLIGVKYIRLRCYGFISFGSHLLMYKWNGLDFGQFTSVILL